MEDSSGSNRIIGTGSPTVADSRNGFQSLKAEMKCQKAIISQFIALFFISFKIPEFSSTTPSGQQYVSFTFNDRFELRGRVPAKKNRTLPHRMGAVRARRR
jgi:hypothetical protein